MKLSSRKYIKPGNVRRATIVARLDMRNDPLIPVFAPFQSFDVMLPMYVLVLAEIQSEQREGEMLI